MLPEVGFPDPVIGQHLGRRAGRDDVPLAHDVSALANIQGFTDVMVRDQHPNIAGFEMRNDVFDIGNGDRVNACKGFIEHQRAFLEIGEIGMKPLVLADIAAEVDLHESTVSRATTRKYMHTPRGTFELKYFFSSRVTGDEGDDIASTAIKAAIKQLVAEEDVRMPLSDAKLCALLKDRDMTVAPRTIAKYREQLAIPPSNERKRLN